MADSSGGQGMIKATRSKAEELALRRSQLERRQKRLAAAKAANATPPPDEGLGVGVPPASISVSSAASPNSRPPPSPSLNDISYGKQPPYAASMVEAGIPPIPAVLEARERAVRMAQNELEMVRKARQEAELKAAEMCQMALLTEKEARQQAEERLRAEEEYTRKKALQTSHGGVRREAAVTIQKIWRGWWLRKCFEEGMAELRRPIEKMQSMWRAAKIRKAVRLAVAQHREKIAHHVCIDKALAQKEPLHPSTVLRIVEVDFEGPLGIRFEETPTGSVVVEPVGEKAASLNVVPGMHLIAFQGGDSLSSQSVAGQPHAEVTALLRSTDRPWKMSFQMPPHHRHKGRTLRSMVEDICLELGIDASLSIMEAVDKAVEITQVADAHSTLHHRCCSVCHHLGIETENEPIKPPSLTGCLKPEFNGDYVFVAEANGRPHWQSTTGYHLWWGVNDTWLLRRTFDPKNANATAFHSPPPDADSSGVEMRGRMSVTAPLGQTDWMWYDPQTKDWVNNLVDIEEGDRHSLGMTQRGGMPVPADSPRRKQLEFDEPQPEPQPELGDDLEVEEEEEEEEIVEELPSTMSMPAGAQMVCRLFDDSKGRWEPAVKRAAEFLSSLSGCVMDVKAHVDTNGRAIIMVLYDPEGEARQRVTIKTDKAKSLNLADALKKLNSKSSLGLVALSITPKSGGASADRKTLQQVVCTGAPGRVPYTNGYPIKCDVVDGTIWREAVKKCQDRCNEITEAGGVIVEVDMVGADTSESVSAVAKKGVVKWGNPCAITILYSEAGGEAGHRVAVTLTTLQPTNRGTADMELNTRRLTELCNDVRRRFICSAFAINTINVERQPKDVCNLLVVAHETLQVQEVSQSTKQLTKVQCREMVRITLDMEKINQSKVPDQWIDDLFDRYDADKSGAVDDSEWESMSEALKVEVAVLLRDGGA